MTDRVQGDVDLREQNLVPVAAAEVLINRLGKRILILQNCAFQFLEIFDSLVRRWIGMSARLAAQMVERFVERHGVGFKLYSKS